MQALLVERDPLQARTLSGYLSDGGFSVAHFEEFPEPSERFDLLVVEYGLARSFDYAQRPVILLVDDSHGEGEVEGSSGSTGYYTTRKPVSKARLLALADRALRAHARLRALNAELARDQDGLCHLTEAHFSFRTRSQAVSIAGSLSRMYPRPSTAGVGILELMINAVEHGNLAVGGPTKQLLIEKGKLDQEIERRLRDPKLGSRRASVYVQRLEDRIELTIEDEGAGFTWNEVHQDDNGYQGRGIQLARALSFTHIDYLPPGNRVVATLRL
ncbi:MAG: hypothetical protein AAGD10_06675 [Myxococcota bacterium]